MNWVQENIILLLENNDIFFCTVISRKEKKKQSRKEFIKIFATLREKVKKSISEDDSCQPLAYE